MFVFSVYYIAKLFLFFLKDGLFLVYFYTISETTRVDFISQTQALEVVSLTMFLPNISSNTGLNDLLWAIFYDHFLLSVSVTLYPRQSDDWVFHTIMPQFEAYIFVVKNSLCIFKAFFFCVQTNIFIKKGKWALSAPSNQVPSFNRYFVEFEQKYLFGHFYSLFFNECWNNIELESESL